MATFILTNTARTHSPIALLVNFRGAKYRRSTGESCEVSRWNKQKKRVRITASNKNDAAINDRLDKIERAADDVVTHLKNYSGIPSAEMFFEVLDEFLYKGSIQHREENQKSERLAEYIYLYIQRYRDVRTERSIKKYTTTAHKIEQYEAYSGTVVRFQDVDIEFYNKFRTWFYSQGYTGNYFGSIMAVVKQTMREAKVVDQLHNSNGIDHRAFIVVSEDVDNVYLSEEELQRIYELDLSQEAVAARSPESRGSDMRRRAEALSLTRDLFLIGAYTGLRVSDFNGLAKANISDKYIRMTTAKTGVEVVIPIHPIVREIITSGFNLSDSVSTQKLNKNIKELCAQAGITEEVKITISKGGVKIVESVRKCDLVSSHTARRSFATNAYKAGVPTIAIMKITGHTKESTFLKYIKVSKEENAELLSNHPFFCNDNTA